MANRELLVPPIAAADPSARELLRMWAARGGQHVSISADAWDDPAMWGIALVDLARHVARAYAGRGSAGVEQTLARIREGFDAEWSSPTDTPIGDMVE